MLYVPEHFADKDRRAALQLVAEHPFATLVTAGSAEPWVTHLPLLHVAEGGPDGALIGHFAAANPHARECRNGPSLAVFHGPHAYISPAQYVEPSKAVPTWNYAVVHVHGRVEPIDDSALTRQVLDRLAERFERDRAVPWRLGLAADALRAMMAAIVAFRMPIGRIEAKLKLSQNRPAADRERVTVTLGESTDPGARAVAALMRGRQRPNEQA